MRQIVVISGKGGAGKTVLTASFAALAGDKVMADCDVDAADLHFLLHPTRKPLTRLAPQHAQSSRNPRNGLQHLHAACRLH